MEIEDYDQYGYIKPKIKRLAPDHIHRIHLTKDIMVGNCYLCQEAIGKGVVSYWNDEDVDPEEET